MPFKDKAKRKEYMRKYRKSKKLVEKAQLEELKKKFPSAYDFLLGKKI
jgi:hypothetical protein